MINLENLKRHSELASEPTYIFDGTEINIAPQRPDILGEENNQIQLADAKWYDFDQGDVPRLQDVIKQLVYHMTISPSRKVKTSCISFARPWRSLVDFKWRIEMRYQK